MKKQEFINLSKNMVAEYINAFTDKENIDRKITMKDVYPVGFHDTPENFRMILSVLGSDDFYYEVIYKKDTKGIYSYVYRQVGKRIIGKRINNGKGIA